MANRWNNKQDRATVFTDREEALNVAAKVKPHVMFKTQVLQTSAGYVIERSHVRFSDCYQYLKYDPPKPKPVVLPNEVWTDAYITQNMVGSITHVSSGNKFFATKEECQHYIDTRPGWIGGGGPKSYRPIQLVKG